MRGEQLNVITRKENSEIFKDADFIVKPEVARKIKITEHPISNDLEYLGSLQLRVEGGLEDDGGRRNLRFKIDSLNPELNLSFKLKPAALERIISANIDGELREILAEKDFTLGPATPKVKAFLNGIGLGIKNGHIELQTKKPSIVKDISAPEPEEVAAEEPKDEVVLHCYQPPETVRPVYGAWCLVCCAICPLPTGLTYTHLKP